MMGAARCMTQRIMPRVIPASVLTDGTLASVVLLPEVLLVISAGMTEP